MHLTTFVSRALALVSTASALTHDDFSGDANLVSRQAPVHNCSAGVHIIAAPGGGHRTGDPYSLIGSLADSIKAAIPHSSHVLLPYPRSNPDKVYATETGSKTLRQYIRQYHAACRQSKIVLLGYSSGAILTMNALCGASESGWQYPASPFPSFWNQSILATVVYGDETFSAGQSWNHGSCEGYGTVPRQNNAGCKAFAAGLHSYCDTADPECCQGDNPEAHYRYPRRYDKKATAWVVSRYNESLQTA